MSVYGRVSSVYRRLPEPARRWAIEHAPGPVLKLRQRLVTGLERRADRDELYDAYYYEHVVDPLMSASATAMARTIQRDLAPRSAIDVGCGTGGLMLELQRVGIDCVGFDAADAALDICRARGLDAHRLDIRVDPIPDRRADLAISTEVAEHLPETAADRFVELLTTIGPTVLMSAAMPGSSGRDHVNEQPNDYWIEKFAARGFGFDRELALRLRSEWRAEGVDEAFFKSLMVFRA